MKKNPFLLSIAALIIVSPSCFAEPYALTEGSVTFSARSRLHAFSGSAKALTGLLDADAAGGRLTGAAETGLKVSDIRTGNSSRDNALRYTLRASDFPEILFKAKSVTFEEKGHGILSGELTVGGVTRQIQMPVDVRTDPERIEVSGSVPLTLSMFQLKPPPLARFLGLDDRVEVHFETLWSRQS